MKIGILALQGAFREHAEVLDMLGVERVLVRSPEDLGALDGLILPGGESTTMSMLSLNATPTQLLRTSPSTRTRLQSTRHSFAPRRRSSSSV